MGNLNEQPEKSAGVNVGGRHLAENTKQVYEKISEFEWPNQKSFA